MGDQKVKPIVTTEQRKKFLYHLLNDVKALDKLVERDMFEKGIVRIGAEQEFCIVNNDFRPSKKSLEILDKINDEHFTTEISLFNLEINLDPIVLGNKCFSVLENNINLYLEKASKAANSIEENKIILTGILPSIRKKDANIKNMTPLDRYRTINNAFTMIRGDEFKMLIKGVDELYIKSKSILFESFNTSFQVHLQIPLDEIIDKYNWAQMIAGPVLSIISNSPLLLGRELWSETRIAVFQQSIDTRNTSYHLREQKPRVSFGYDWVKDSITNVYKDDISRYTAILTADEYSNSLDEIEAGKTPALKALSLHNSTLYKWNRLCYGITNGKPHFRIENRYIPAGPTVKDEIANTMFWIGLMQGMPNEYKEIWKQIPFKDARGNFIKAARTGIDTYFNWFGEGISAKKLIKKILLPIAKEGLKKANVDSKDIKYYLEIIKDRIHENQTGSKWVVRNYRTLKKELSNDEANITLTSAIYNRQQLGIPVSQWDGVHIKEGFGIPNLYDKIRKVMTTELFVVFEGDPIELVLSIMKWKKINHIPVVNKSNKIVGMITQKIVKEAIVLQKNDDLLSAKQIMKKVTIKVDPDTTIEHAQSIMKSLKLDYLPVIEDEELIGIFTKSDLKKVTNKKKLYD